MPQQSRQHSPYRSCPEPGVFVVDRVEWMAAGVGRLWAYTDHIAGVSGYMHRHGTFSSGTCESAAYSFR